MSSRDQLSGITLRSRPAKYNEIRQFGAAQIERFPQGSYEELHEASQL
jgi:hypothetical protein